jgi:hypothetical protein
MAYVGKSTTLTATFNGGVPGNIAATGNGAAIPVSNLRVTVNSGSGATAKGFFSFETVLPEGVVTISITANGQPGAATHTTTVLPASQTYTVPAALPVAFMPHGAASPVGFRVESKPGFAKGYLRADQHLVGTVDGQSFEIQQDREPPPYSDGSVRAARLTWAMRVGVAADTAKAMTVSVAAGAPNRTPWITPQAIVAADDWDVRATGMDLSNTVLRASLRNIVMLGPRDDWGVNPTMGWEVTLAGPQQVGLRAWQMLDAWRKAWIYVIYHADGRIDHQEMVTAPNWDGPVPGAPAGPLDQVTQHRVVCAFETFCNGGRVAANGGPNDPRAVVVPASQFSTANGFCLMPPGISGGMCIVLTPEPGGTMPSGLTAGAPYWIFSYGDAYGNLHVRRGDCAYNDAPIALGTAGTGNLKVTPWVSVHPFGGSAFMDTDARPYRIGGGKLDYGIAWDEKAMSTGAQMFPRYDQATTRYPSPADPVADYHPQMTPFGFTFNNYGDDPGTDWVGLINETAVLALLNPFDANFCKYARVTGACLADWPIHLDDIASGRPLACDNGPNNDGGRYPGMGAARPRLGWNEGGNQWAPSVNYTKTDGPDAGGYTSRYSNAPLDASHVPSPAVVPAHHTGNPLFEDLILQEANCAVLSDIRHQTFDGVTYMAPLAVGQQTRGEGWGFALWINVEGFLPASRPEAVYAKGRLDLYEKWCVAAASSIISPNSSMSSAIQLIDHDGDVGFFFVIFMQCICRELARNERPGIRVMAAALANVMLGVVDEADPAGGSTYFADSFYHPHTHDASNNQYPDLRTMLAAEGDFGNKPAPYPTTGFVFGNHQAHGDAFASTSTAVKLRCFLALAASANLVSLKGHNARAILARLEARAATAPCVGWEFSSPNYNHSRFGNYPRMFPVHMIVPFDALGSATPAPIPAPNSTPTPAPTPSPTPTQSYTVRQFSVSSSVNVNGGSQPVGTQMYVLTAGGQTPASVNIAFGSSATVHPVQGAAGGEYGVNNSDGGSASLLNPGSYPGLWAKDGVMYIWPNGHPAGSTRTLYYWAETVAGSGNWVVLTNPDNTPFTVLVTY